MSERPRPVTKTDLVRALRAKGESSTAAAAALERVLESITAALAAGHPVMIRGFGRFEPRLRNPRTLANPTNGQQMQVPSRWTVGFVPADRLKNLMNGT